MPKDYFVRFLFRAVAIRSQTRSIACVTQQKKRKQTRLGVGEEEGTREAQVDEQIASELSGQNPYLKSRGIYKGQ